ncbi:hypothetical protein BURK1_03321 [Burkholderiales bacterium]|nr:hypothetical protein BURK1_03321 [Burkholderiales bacterium]
MTAIRSALLVTAFALLPACATDMTGPTLDVSGTDAVARQFDCIETAADGVTCNKKQCKAGPGGFTFYCDTYAYYCVKAGHKWEGTKVIGTCTRTHPN